MKVVRGGEPVMVRSQMLGLNPYACVPAIYVDGIPVRLRTSIEGPRDPRAFEAFAPPLEHIDAIEVYPGGASLPARWRSSNSGCGVIAIWTKH